MDLSLLPHLSERALRDEAERRGLSYEGLGREELIVAIRAHEAGAMTLPPKKPAPSPFAPTVPPERGALDAAKKTARDLVGRVMGIVRGASEPPAAPAAEEEASEPIRTRSMARLLEQQGHLERALAIVRALSAEQARDEELARWSAVLERRIEERALTERARSRLAELAGNRVELIAGKVARGVVWRVDEEGIARARALLGLRGVLALRVIRVLAHADRAVETRQEDRRPLEASGWAKLDVPANARLVVSVGLADGDRFVSIAHASS